MSNFFISLNVLLNRLLAFLVLRHKEDRWGIVYDSVSKQPLDPVIVKLIDARTGKVFQSSVTDLAGRYNFLAYPGKFKILVKKSNYLFPSQISAGGSDEVYQNLYHGEFFELRGDSEVISFNIPMDPEHRDWNQAAKLEMAPYHPYIENFVYGITAVVFWTVLILDAASIYIWPTLFAYWLLGFYGACLLLAWLLPYPRMWGRVFLKNGESAEGLMLEISYASLPDIILVKAAVYGDGKFFLRLSPGKYIYQIKKHYPELPSKTLNKGSIRVGFEQVINRNFAI
jgi:hypothetical protein